MMHQISGAKNIYTKVQKQFQHLPKIYHNIDDEHDVDNQFNNNDWVVQPLDVVKVHLLPLHFLVIQFQVEDGNKRLRFGDYYVIYALGSYRNDSGVNDEQ